MIIFYCALLVVILFLTFMEIITYPANIKSFVINNYQVSHITHVLAYVITFMCVCLLLKYELYM